MLVKTERMKVENLKKLFKKVIDSTKNRQVFVVAFDPGVTTGYCVMSEFQPLMVGEIKTHYLSDLSFKITQKMNDIFIFLNSNYSITSMVVENQYFSNQTPQGLETGQRAGVIVGSAIATLISLGRQDTIPRLFRPYPNEWGSMYGLGKEGARKRKERKNFVNRFTPELFSPPNKFYGEHDQEACMMACWAELKTRLGDEDLWKDELERL